MDEQEIQRKRRENEELATKNRARILGLPYLDTRGFEDTIPLVPDVINVAEMHKNFIIPLQAGDGATPFRFMVTSQTPNSLIPEMQKKYTEAGQHVAFFLISKSAYQVFMLRYDPPKEVHYEDIKISSDGDSDTIAEVSQTLPLVG